MSQPAPATSAPQPPVQNDISPSDPASYVRDPHKLVGYLVPFPQPTKLPHGVPAPPPRFVLYTPPPPPLMKPQAGEKENLSHKIQRKWQEEVREAKTSNAKVASWKGIKGRVTKGISWAVDKTTSADLDFVTRIPKDDDSDSEGETTKGTVRLEEMVLVYPESFGVAPEKMREEFVNSLMRTKSKAERDAVIATGLLPVAAVADWALILVGWVFGGFLEVDGVWAASSIKGAKTARSISKRISSSTKSGDPHAADEKLKLTFVPSSRAEVLQSYLATRCAEQDHKVFPAATHQASTDDVLESIGWTPSGQYEEKNWEDDAWERTQVGDDVQVTMKKAAKAWDHWVKAYGKNPAKAADK